MSNVAIKQISQGADRFANLCREFIKKLIDLGVATGSLPTARNPNRVELKKVLLSATRGRSVTSFVRSLSLTDKRHLLTMMHMECPVTCPNRKIMLPPVESMPSKVMKSAKQLRNFFGIPETQVCRGCVKRGRCRRYQQVERDTPDLSDIAAMLIGVYSTCKLSLQGSPLVIAEASLKELPSVTSVVDALSSYIQASPHSTDGPSLEGRDRQRLLQKYKKLKEMRKVELLKEKVFNLPTSFGVNPEERTYMTSFQRAVYSKLHKSSGKRKEDEGIWLADRGDTTLPDDTNATLKGLPKLNDVELDKNCEISPSDTAESGDVQELNPAFVQFRMTYDTPIGRDVDLLRYDLVQDAFIQGIKVNAKGRVVVDLEKHQSGYKQEGIEIAQGVESYRPVSQHKISHSAIVVDNLRTNSGRLSFLKRVHYTYQCQSSGATEQQEGKRESEARGLYDVATALSS
ncbi:uncharacterized protein BXIN_0587 [Babesia sp. Xinjiang]|uniref:uncharacterized protein n=1 Tax=Babesia sp. Xinjiang TaxID=462227 RepID=UPI000A23B7C5|nr:uncharacterized protein BXIN_0587 [Babesia sp. Xinjiang]ORM41821.1 hypothetical protein BXIN_0587 [Babesia sp. Xinjiang]